MAFTTGVQLMRDIANFVAGHGVSIVWAPGWENRSNGQSWAPRGPKGFVNHHTAGSNNIYLDQNLIHGIQGLSGPLCNVAGLYDGDLAVVSAGPANHAGASGGWDTAPLPNTGYFNREVLGLEVQYRGTEPMSPEQYRTMCLVNRAAQEILGWPANGIRSKNHQGTSIQGKWDPGYAPGKTYPIAQTRRDVAAVLAPVPPPAQVVNEIDAEAARAAAWIGKRLHVGERPCKDGVGRYADFENGSIYWHPSMPNGEAIAVPSRIYETWKANGWEQGMLGYPKQHHTVLEGGEVQDFAGGVIYRQVGKDGYIVHGLIGERWANDGFETGSLGWPVGDEEATADGGRVQRFERGSFAWHPSGVTQLSYT